MSETEDLLGWLSEAASRVELPIGWVVFEDDAGRPAYYHEGKKLVTRKHPVLHRLHDYAERLRRFYSVLASKESLRSIGVKPCKMQVLGQVVQQSSQQKPKSDSSKPENKA